MDIKKLLKPAVAIIMCSTIALSSYAEGESLSIVLGENGTLKEQLGEKIYTVEDLTVGGVPSEDDFNTMWECGFFGKLQSLDLSELESDIPQYAFYHPEEQGELGSESFKDLRISKISLPQKTVTINKYSFAGIGVKTLDFPRFLGFILDYAFAYSNLEKIEFNVG